MSEHKHTNRLAQETSPYLLQHAHNPVDWYPWGTEVFERAKAEDRPILLSVGYSACHWCHVMERESFENEAIAALMNREFLCVKVDREERPDVDAIYMSAVQMLTGQGGWPMTVFLTPEGKPFFGGTYYPPEDRYGVPGFPRLLAAVSGAWKLRRSAVETQSLSLTEELAKGDSLGNLLADTDLTPGILENAYLKFEEQFDPEHGGFGSAPKFPQPANLDFLLRCHGRTGEQEPLTMVETTLQRMALGGIFDQLGGGFHRYSTDRTWLVPHFEKMLYDNAQLVGTYTRAWQVTANAFYQSVATETLEYVMKEMTGPEGGFYSAQDADSEGEEGKYFVWTPEEIVEVLGEANAAVFRACFDVTQAGNWEGKNILHVVMSAPDAAARFERPLEEIAELLDDGRTALLTARDLRVKPGLDDKVLTSWNGLMLAAFADAAAAFDDGEFRQVAVRNADFLLTRLAFTDAEGRLRLYRTYRNGQARLNGYLEDYAFLAEGLIRLYQTTFELRWLETAIQLTETMFALFWDEEHDGFYATSSDHETLIQRPKDWDDNATPSGNSVAVEVLLQLAAFTDNEEYRRRAELVLRKLAPAAERHPYSFARILGAMDLHLAAPKEIAIIGDPEDSRTKALLRTVYSTYLPNTVIALAPAQVSGDSTITLLADRARRDGKPTAYVCENRVCKTPVTTPADLAAQLSASRG